MPHALKKAGFGVWVFCPHGAMLLKSECLDGGRAFSGPIVMEQLAGSIVELVAESAAQVIVPCDDAASRLLEMFCRQPGMDAAFERARSLAADWLGLADPGLRRRSATLAAAARIGIRAPRQILITPALTRADELAQLGCPIVVKADHTSGGGGILIVRTPEEAIDGARVLAARRHALFPDGEIAAQEFVPGIAAAVSFSALKGEVLAQFAYRIVHRHPQPLGPSSVIEIVDDPGMMEATRRLVAHLGYSGFGGIDFVLPQDGGPPVFLELNARPTQTTHLGGSIGADLCGALACAVSGRPYRPAPDRVAGRTIALFPSEWRRDRNSPYLSGAYHDVPWSEQRIAASMIAAGA
ncbi:ATP-grasp domain-containing protein [Arenibaculum pallidiluteum]|uniref:ATP-grasp domain-containing protein n=1 Tax=Arenibaculum pallidiluteum TaxID=2812559 RepID=UPI001A96CFA8|nr:ATP-grasp domain-containing protein [Arenibaculum pallidiluteum]